MSHTLLILKIYTTFKDVQMMLKQFFDISTVFRFSKLQWGSVPSIPVSCPCSGLVTVHYSGSHPDPGFSYFSKTSYLLNRFSRWRPVAKQWKRFLSIFIRFWFFMTSNLTKISKPKRTMIFTFSKIRFHQKI